MKGFLSVPSWLRVRRDMIRRSQVLRDGRRVRSSAERWRRVCVSALGGFQDLLELLNADALPGIGAPFDTGRADRAGVQMSALLAGGFRLVAPDLDLFAALLAPDVFRLRRPYLNASWTTFFKHDPTLHPLAQMSYDVNHIGLPAANQRIKPLTLKKPDNVYDNSG